MIHTESASIASTKSGEFVAVDTLLSKMPASAFFFAAFSTSARFRLARSAANAAGSGAAVGDGMAS